MAIPDGARRIDLRGRWLIPGLMNMHVHPGLVLPGDLAAELADETDAALALRNAKAQLALYPGNPCRAKAHLVPVV